MKTVHFPFRVMPKPRMTRGSKWNPRSKRYFGWRDHVATLWRMERVISNTEVENHCQLDVVVRSGVFSVSVTPCTRGCRPKMRGDLSNMLKAVEDALNGIAYPDDSVKHVCRVSCTYEEGAENDATEGSLGQDP